MRSNDKLSHFMKISRCDVISWQAGHNSRINSKHRIFLPYFYTLYIYWFLVSSRKLQRLAKNVDIRISWVGGQVRR